MEKFSKRNHYDIYNIKPDARMDAWIWLYHRERNRGYIACDFSEQSVQNLAHAVGVDEFLRLRDSESKRFLLPVETLEWISRDKRLIKWILKYIDSHLKCEIADCPPGLHGRERVIASFDLWDVPLNEKNRAVRDMEQIWYEIRKEDELFDWFKDNEKIKIEFAWKWLVKNGRADKFKGPPVSSLKELLAFYDEINASATIKKLDAKSIKGSFSFGENVKQKKEGGQSQCNFWISYDAKLKLEKMCHDFGLSKKDFIEKLIISEFERKNAVDDKAKEY